MVRFIETENRMKVTRAQVEGNKELVFKGHRVSVWEGEKVMEVDGGDGGTTMRMC